jgi:uncharacterized membrane protein
VSGAIRNADAAINRRNGRGSNTVAGSDQRKILAVRAAKKNALDILTTGRLMGVTVTLVILATHAASPCIIMGARGAFLYSVSLLGFSTRFLYSVDNRIRNYLDFPLGRYTRRLRPFWDGERIKFSPPSPLANGSARQAPISSVRR